MGAINHKLDGVQIHRCEGAILEERAPTV